MVDGRVGTRRSVCNRKLVALAAKMNHFRAVCRITKTRKVNQVEEIEQLRVNTIPMTVSMIEFRSLSFNGHFVGLIQVVLNYLYSGTGRLIFF